MHQYQHTLDLVKRLGVHKGDRTGTGTQSMFGQQKCYSLRNNQLPTITTKKIHLPSIIHELFWMLSGNTRVDYLIENGVRIWNEWVKPETAVYRALTLDELKAAIFKKYNTNEEDFEVVHIVADTYVTEIDPSELPDESNQETVEPTLVGYRWHPYLSKNCLFLDVGAYGKTVVDTPSLEEHQKDDYIKNWTHWAKIYKLVFEKSPTKLIGGDLGPVYGKTWRDIDDVRIISKLEWIDYEARGFEFVVDLPGTDMGSDQCVVKRKIDQIQDIIYQLRDNPDSRRIIVCAWNPALVDEQALPPCHSLFQFWTRELSTDERIEWLKRNDPDLIIPFGHGEEYLTTWMNHVGVPLRALSCHLYCRHWSGLIQ